MKPSLNNIIVYALMFSLASLISFFFIPNSQWLMAFSGNLFYKNMEFWRIISFPFIHVDLTHLLQNIVAIGVITFLAYEINLKAAIYIGSFFTASIIIALITGVALPALIIAGLSMGIYSIIGTISIEGSNFVPKKILIPLFAMAALIEPALHISDITVLKSSLFHIFGYIFGIAFIIAAKKVVPKRRVLTLKKAESLVL